MKLLQAVPCRHCCSIYYTNTLLYFSSFSSAHAVYTSCRIAQLFTILILHNNVMSPSFYILANLLFLLSSRSLLCSGCLADTSISDCLLIEWLLGTSSSSCNVSSSSVFRALFLLFSSSSLPFNQCKLNIDFKKIYLNESSTVPSGL